MPIVCVRADARLAVSRRVLVKEKQEAGGGERRGEDRG